jgi:hypothetical protein
VVLRYRKEFELLSSKAVARFRLVRTLNFQFPILAHFLYARNTLLSAMMG